MRAIPKIARQIHGVVGPIYEAFNDAVPARERMIDARPGLRSGAFASVPTRELAAMAYRLVRSQLPHDAEHQPIPEHYERWREIDGSGADITNWYAVAGR